MFINNYNPWPQITNDTLLKVRISTLLQKNRLNKKKIDAELFGLYNMNEAQCVTLTFSLVQREKINCICD